MGPKTTPPRYPSDLTDAEWALLDPLIPRARKAGRPQQYSKRTILNAIFYLVRSGCPWRMLPHDLPPWRLVWHYFAHWKSMALGPNSTTRCGMRCGCSTVKKSSDRCDPRLAECAHN